MADIITVRPSLLTYRNRVVLDGVEVVLFIQYRARTNDWFLSVEDPTGQPILQGVRVVPGVDLVGGVRDSRMPPGGLWAIRIGDPQSLPRAGEFGDAVQLFYLREADFQEAAQENPDLVSNLLAPASIKAVEDAV